MKKFPLRTLILMVAALIAFGFMWSQMQKRPKKDPTQIYFILDDAGVP
jgi:hypothetical protein